MLGELRELWRFRELLRVMVERELRIRYKNSALGFLWSFLNPLATTIVLTFVFGTLNPNGVESFSAYILAAYLPYLFFQQSVLDGAQSILSGIQLVRKIYFPRELLPLAAILANFIHLLMGFAVFFLFLLAVWILHPGQSPFRATTLLLPGLLLLSLMFSTGLALLVAAWNTFYEDVKYLASLALYLLFFLSPITYLSEMVAYSPLNQRTGGLIYKLYHLNPVAALSTAYRQILLAPQRPLIGGRRVEPIPLDPAYLGVTALVSVATLWIGYRTFNRLKWRFVERA